MTVTIRNAEAPMLQHFHRAFLSSFALLALAAGAKAQSVAGSVQEFGLVGAWAIECTQLPSPQNEHSIFTIADTGSVRLRNDFGRDYDEMVYRIISARLVAPDKVALRQVLMNDSRIVLDTVMLKSDDRIRVWSSHGLDGMALVSEGTIPSTNGHETRWALRCRDRWTGDVGSVNGISFDPANRAVDKPRMK
jgi:hypothetical protein